MRTDNSVRTDGSVAMTTREPRSILDAIRREQRMFWLLGCSVGFLWACDEPRDARVEPRGKEATMETEVLKAGAEILQGNEPTDKLDVYLVGFHPMKDEPHHQMEAHHYCHQMNEEFAQCVLFDSNEEDANLNGIEYIISERLYEQLSAEEQRYWHPHNYEILSGQLIAPAIPQLAEMELMRGKMNSYGKTWHTWTTGSAVTEGGDFPLGEPQLAWSFNADGEAKKGLVESRDRAMDVDTQEIRREREQLVKHAKPQRGVDALADAFPTRKQPRGIRERAASAEAGAPDAQ